MDNAKTYSTVQSRKDCVVRALANVSGIAYDDAFNICEAAGRKPGRGMNKKLWLPVFEKHAELELSRYLSDFKTIKSLSKKLIERGGIYLVQVQGHVAVFKDGTWLDWIDSDRLHRVKAVWKVANKEAA
jgi:hypothetical protein